MIADPTENGRKRYQYLSRRQLYEKLRTHSKSSCGDQGPQRRRKQGSCWKGEHVSSGTSSLVSARQKAKLTLQQSIRPHRRRRRFLESWRRERHRDRWKRSDETRAVASVEERQGLVRVDCVSSISCSTHVELLRGNNSGLRGEKVSRRFENNGELKRGSP